MTYALQATTLGEQQCAKIMKPAINKALPVLGINQHFLWAVVHGPKNHQGLAIPNLFMEQTIVHITTLLCYGPQEEDPTGWLLQANLEAFRLETGLSSQCFGQLVEVLPCLMHSWIAHMWTQC